MTTRDFYFIWQPIYDVTYIHVQVPKNSNSTLKTAINITPFIVHVRSCGTEAVSASHATVPGSIPGRGDGCQQRKKLGTY